MNLLLELALRGTLLMALTGAALWAASPFSAKTRRNILRFCFAGLVLLPLGLLLPIRVEAPLLTPPPAIESPQSIVEAEAIPLAPSEPESSPAGPDWVSLALLGFFGFGAIRIGLDFAKLGKLWKGGKACGAAESDLAREASEMLNLSRPPATRLTLAPSPMVYGVRSRILLPSSFASWPEGEKRTAILHESAHLKARDGFWVSVACLAEALWAWHPGMWILAKSHRLQMELAADDLVIAQGIHRLDYAASLVSITQHCSRATSPVSWASCEVASPSHLEQRIKMTLKNPSKPSALRRFANVGLTLTFAALSFAALAVQPVEAPKPPASPVKVTGVELPKVAPAKGRAPQKAKGKKAKKTSKSAAKGKSATKKKGVSIPLETAKAPKKVKGFKLNGSLEIVEGVPVAPMGSPIDPIEVPAVAPTASLPTLPVGVPLSATDPAMTLPPLDPNSIAIPAGQPVKKTPTPPRSPAARADSAAKPRVLAPLAAPSPVSDPNKAARILPAPAATAAPRPASVIEPAPAPDSPVRVEGVEVPAVMLPLAALDSIKLSGTAVIKGRLIEGLAPLERVGRTIEGSKPKRTVKARKTPTRKVAPRKATPRKVRTATRATRPSVAKAPLKRSSTPAALPPRSAAG